MTTDMLTAHAAAEDVFDEVLTKVDDDAWDRPTACTEWTIRDLAAHATWGRDLVRLCAGGGELDDRTAAPGAPTPAAYVSGDPLAVYRKARSACDAVLDAPALDRTAPSFFRANFPSATLGDFLARTVVDLVVHAWDVGDALGSPVTVDPELLSFVQKTSREVPRAPGAFASPAEAPPGADDLTRLAAHLGRTSVRSSSR